MSWTSPAISTGCIAIDKRSRKEKRERTMLRVKSLMICFAFIVAFAGAALGQNLPKVRAAYTSIGIQFDPVYIMKELDLPRKYGVDAEILFVPVSSRAIQAALAGEIQFITSGGVANINANVNGADFVGLTATLNRSEERRV